MNPAVDLQSLLQSAYLVRAAYDLPSIRAGHTQGHVAYYPADNTCVVSFAGSNDRHDWGDNFNFFHRKYLGDRGAARVSALVVALTEWNDGEADPDVVDLRRGEPQRTRYAHLAFLRADDTVQ